MTAQQTAQLAQDAITAIDTGDVDTLRPMLSPNVRFRSAPHTIQFPGNLVEHLRSERERTPDLRLVPETVFADESGTNAVAIAQWTRGNLRSHVSVVFRLNDGLIEDIEIFGGLARLMYDVGLQRVA